MATLLASFSAVTGVPMVTLRVVLIVEIDPYSQREARQRNEHGP